MQWIKNLPTLITKWRSSRDDYKQLDGLLASVPAEGVLAEQVLWLAELLHWIRARPTLSAGSADSSTFTFSQHTRLRYFVRALETNPNYSAAIARMFQQVILKSDALSLFVDTGLAQREGLAREIWSRIKLKVLPLAPNDGTLTTLFSLLFESDDRVWIEALSPELSTQLATVVASDLAVRDKLGGAIEQAIVLLASQIANGMSDAKIRLRTEADEISAKAILHLPALAVELLKAVDPTTQLQQLNQFRATIDLAREAATKVYEHLDLFGVSVAVVFDVEQILRRSERLEQLLVVWASSSPANEATRFIATLVHTSDERASVRGLLRESYSLLGKKVVERSAETGEHYIARSRGEYLTMLKRASGGGAITAITVYLKFLITGLGMSRFFEGLFLFFDYAASFLAIHFAHFTLATKQPAMTAPALATKLDSVADEPGKQEFVDETIALIRSQVAAVVGNLAMVIPVALVIQLIWIYATGSGAITEAKALKSIESFSILGWTPVFAAFTGVLLWLSSLSGGWADNWVALHRLADGLRFHRRFQYVFGQRGADNFARFVENNAAGVASNLALALLLGFVPIIAAFFGLGLDVRHVTLSTGSIAAAVGVLGSAVISTSAFWLAIGGVAAMGVLNIGVSFYLAFAMALSSSRVNISDRRALRRRVVTALLRKPHRVLLPPKS